VLGVTVDVEDGVVVVGVTTDDVVVANVDCVVVGGVDEVLDSGTVEDEDEVVSGAVVEVTGIVEVDDGRVVVGVEVDVVVDGGASVVVVVMMQGPR
jgi:hypothetical protein